MKTLQILFIGLLVFGIMAILSPSTNAQTCDSTNSHFVDLNGDGFNDNAPDFDGDGIPNGLDPDYIKQAKDGTGQQKGKLYLNGQADGIKSMNKFQKKNRFGYANSFKFQSRVGNGSGNLQAGTGTGVCDGSGPNGGSAVCDGTGPKGPQGRGGK